MLTNISYNTVKPSDHAIVLGAGPSVKTNLEAIKEYYYKYKPVVISANYSHNIPVNYTLFVDKRKYKEQKYNVENKIVVGRKIEWKNDKDLYPKIMPIKHSPWPSYLKTKKIVIHSNGKINHEVGNAGFASMLISAFFKPHKILAAGFDGPDTHNKFQHFNGHITKFSKVKTKLVPNRNFLKLLISFLRKKEIEITVFENDNFWKLDKKNVGLKIY